MTPWNETLSAVSEFNLLKAQSWGKKNYNNNADQLEKGVVGMKLRQ